MIRFDLLGEACYLNGASYGCDALRLHGYATESKLAAAIRRKRKAATPPPARTTAGDWPYLMSDHYDRTNRGGGDGW